MAVENERLQKQFIQIRDRNRVLENRLSRHDIGNLGVSRPESTERVLNGATKNVSRCFEIISGSPLTEKELSATKSKESAIQSVGELLIQTLILTFNQRLGRIKIYENSITFNSVVVYGRLCPKANKTQHR